VTAMPKPRTIHDFGRSLPAALFECQYPVPGDPELAAQVADLLSSYHATLDQSWGLDHGTWAVLSKAWPAADIPVLQISLDAGMPNSERIELGRKLIPLRDEGVLLAGSGNIVHNLGEMQWDENAAPHAWATRFNDRIKNIVADGDEIGLCNYEAMGEDARLAVADPDHFWALMYLIGASDDDAVTFHTDFIQYKSLSMTSLVFAS